MITHIFDALYIWIGLLLLPRTVPLAFRMQRYRAGLLQRLGFAPELERKGMKRIWIHCASVGEAAVPRKMVDMIKRDSSETELVFSSCTDTGVERLQKIYPGNTVFFCPCDLSICVHNAIKRIKPDALILVEQEIWPNLLMASGGYGIPVAIINGRMRERSSRLVRCLARLCPQALDAIKICCVRSATDADRFQYTGLNVDRVVNTGSLKYESLDTAIPEERVKEEREQFNFGPSDRVLVGGSTHDGEEAALAALWRRLREDHADLRLMLVPRHIERAARIVRSLQHDGFKVELKTRIEQEGRKPDRDAIILVDTVGQLMNCYALARAVFVGRSLFRPGGGQNMMEPAALGKPVVVGSHTGNFRSEMEVLSAQKAIKVVRDEEELEAVLRIFLECGSYADSLGRRARETVISNSGAAERTLAALSPMIDCP